MGAAGGTAGAIESKVRIKTKAAGGFVLPSPVVAAVVAGAAAPLELGFRPFARACKMMLAIGGSQRVAAQGGRGRWSEAEGGRDTA